MKYVYLLAIAGLIISSQAMAVVSDNNATSTYILDKNATSTDPSFSNPTSKDDVDSNGTSKDALDGNETATDLSGSNGTPKAYTATVLAGPSLSSGARSSADILVNNKLAIRIAASAAKLSPMERAVIIAQRMNQAFDSGSSWNDIRVAQMGNQWTVTLGNKLIATADETSARLKGTSAGDLASHWAAQSVVALGGNPDDMGSQLQPVTSMVAGSAEEFGTPTKPVVWTAATTKRVPLLNADSGTEIGFVTAAGERERLETVTSVIAIKSTAEGGATIYTFVPAVGPGIASPVVEVKGVGITSLPESIVPQSGMITNTRLNDAIKQHELQWDAVIKSARSNFSLSAREAARIVPLYSAETGHVVGAAQAMGADSVVSNVRSMVMTKSDGMLNLNASLSADKSSTDAASPVANVFVSSVILMQATDAGTEQMDAESDPTDSVPMNDTETEPMDAESGPTDELTLPAPPDEELLNNNAP